MEYLTLADTASGPDWILSAVTVLFAVISVLLLTGKGSWLIAGYNTASKKEKAKYNEKLLCKVVGTGFAVITAALAVMALFDEYLPAGFIGIFVFIVFMCIAIILFLSNTICRISEDDPNQKEENK